MTHSIEVQGAIEGLYTTFASYPLRDDTTPCPCCHSAHDERRLRSKKLRELSAADLWQYAFSALFTWGDANDFKHFLPRIFELVVTAPDEFVDPQVLTAKLHHGDWRFWPNEEQRSVERFLTTVWDSVLETEPHDYSYLVVEDWLCGVAQAENQLSSYLDTWLARDTDNARLNLAAFIAETDFVGSREVPDGYWRDRSELFWEVAAWVRSDPVKVRMSKIVADFPQYDFVERAYVSLP